MVAVAPVVVAAVAPVTNVASLDISLATAPHEVAVVEVATVSTSLLSDTTY
jgi:hypothetical protein